MRVLGLAFAVLLAGCSFHLVDHPGDGPGGDDTAVGTALRKRITIDKSHVMGTQLQFPVWISLPGDTELAAHAGDSGSDIYFTDASGAPLPYELQRWTKSAGDLEAWVRTDLDNRATTVIELRYGDRTRAPGENPKQVFSSSFVAVWHLDDPLTSADVADATTLHPGVAGGLDPSDQVAGPLGGSVNFDGASKRINFTLPLTGNMEHTISAWVNQRTASGFDSIITMGNPNSGDSRWFHSHYLAGISAGFYGGGNNDWPSTPALPNIDGTGWVLLHWTYKSNRQSHIYRNGVEVGSYTFNSNASTQGTDGNLGYAPAQWGQAGVPCWLNGILDEVRIATVERNAGWIATEYANQSAPQTFYAVGPEESVP